MVRVTLPVGTGHRRASQRARRSRRGHRRRHPDARQCAARAAFAARHRLLHPDHVDAPRGPDHGHRALRGARTLVATLRDCSSALGPGALCLAVRTNQLRGRWAKVLSDHGLPTAVLTQDEPNNTGIRIANMHPLTGLEFPRLVLASVQHDTLPQPFHTDADATQRARDLDAERCLLCVAATRARDLLGVTGTGTPSALIPELRP